MLKETKGKAAFSGNNIGGSLASVRSDNPLAVVQALDEEQAVMEQVRANFKGELSAS